MRGRVPTPFHEVSLPSCAWRRASLNDRLAPKCRRCGAGTGGDRNLGIVWRCPLRGPVNGRAWAAMDGRRPWLISWRSRTSDDVPPGTATVVTAEGIEVALVN